MRIANLDRIQQQRHDLGLCARCGDDAHGFWYCYGCRAARRAKEKRRTRKRRRNTSPEAYARQLERERKKYAEARANGLCHKCGQKAERFVECMDCRLTKKAQAAERKLRKKEQSR